MTVTWLGWRPTATVAVTVLVAVLITETVLEFWLVTYNRVPSVLNAKLFGNAPTLMVAVMALVVVLMTLDGVGSVAGDIEPGCRRR